MELNNGFIKELNLLLVFNFLMTSYYIITKDMIKLLWQDS